MRLSSSGLQRLGDQPQALGIGDGFQLRRQLGGRAPAAHRLGRDVEARHDAGVHRDEVDLRHVAVQPDQRLVDQSPLVGVQQVQGGLGAFRLLLVPGHQHPLAQGGEHLHGGDAAARRDARHGLDGQGGDARQLQHAFQAVVVEQHGVVPVHVPAPEEVHLPPAVDDLPVGEVGVLAVVSHRRAPGRG